MSVEKSNAKGYNQSNGELQITNEFMYKKLKVTVRANEPSYQAIMDFNKKLKQLFYPENLW